MHRTDSGVLAVGAASSPVASTTTASVSVPASTPSADIASGTHRRAGVHFRRLLSGELANKAFRFLSAGILARALSPNDFGVFNIGVACAGVMFTVTSLGLSEVATRDLATDASQTSWLAGRVLAARTTAVALLAGLAVVITALLWRDRIGVVVAVAAMCIAMVTTGEWLARGLEQMRRVAVGTALGGLTSVVGAVIVLFVSGSAVLALALFAVAELVASLSFWTAARHTRPRFGFSGLAPLLRRGAPLAVSALAIYSYYANVDTIIIGATRSATEAGYYSAAYRLFLACNIVAIFAAYSLFPITARARDSSPYALAMRIRPVSMTLVAYGGMVVGFSELLGPTVLRLAFGPSFASATEAFVLLCMSTCWYCTAYPYGYSLVAMGLSGRFSSGAIAAGLLSLVLDFALIPPLGMDGAALATLISIMLGACLWFREVILSGELRSLVATLIALTVTGAMAVLVPPWRPIVGAGTALVSAAAVVIALRHARQPSHVLGS